MKLQTGVGAQFVRPSGPSPNQTKLHFRALRGRMKPGTQRAYGDAGESHSDCALACAKAVTGGVEVSVLSTIYSLLLFLLFKKKEENLRGWPERGGPSSAVRVDDTENLHLT